MAEVLGTTSKGLRNAAGIHATRHVEEPRRKADLEAAVAGLVVAAPFVAVALLALT